jgi:hypothetical protein
MKLIIAGSRDFDDYEFLSYHAALITSDDCSIPEIVSGTARGADQLGERWAAEHDCHIKRFPADWTKYGKGAGYIRNTEMAQYADTLLAFWDGQSRGTSHMIDCALKSPGITRILVIKEHQDD